MKILVVEDDNVQRDLLVGALKKEYNISGVPSGEAAVELLQREVYDIILMDMNLGTTDGITTMKEIHKINPEIIIIIITAYGNVENAVNAIKEGAYDYLTKPIDLTKLKLTIKRAIETKQLTQENKILKTEIGEKYGFDNIIGNSTAIQEVLNQVARVSKSSSTVLILGESGTGKELIAKAIHYSSLRTAYPFVPVACAALPDTLLEAELFGYEKGAFTGAQQERKGRFEIADKGTLFLDEIGDIPLSTQVKLLRVLQEQEFEKLGSNKPIKVDVRVISATNQPLEQRIKEGTFREDLYYRLNVVPIIIPPLRERKEDISLLIEHFLKKYGTKIGKTIEGINSEAKEILLRYNWPGNVRELENIIERAVVMTRNNIIQPDDLPKTVLTTGKAKDNFSIEYMEKLHIEEVLKKTNWNLTKSAELLKIHRNTLREKIRNLHIVK
ncbi:MAG: sigma-54 dependent transcriptional regulator [bacterium]|nr:sigma-54 dependent transcriptional regulator [bacterium]